MGKRLGTFSGRRPRFALPGLLGLVALLVGVIILAPAAVSLALAVGTAGAWCRWLERSAGFTSSSAS